MLLKSKSWSVRGAVLVGMASVMVLEVPGWLYADEGNVGKRNKSEFVQLDLSKLPPELAKQVRKYAAARSKTDERHEGHSYGKGKVPQLPPGLANKPANHPGRVAFLENVGQKMQDTNKPQKDDNNKSKKKKPSKGD